MTIHAQPIQRSSSRSLVARQRFAALSALLLVPLIPLALRFTVLATPQTEPSTINSLIGNVMAVVFAVWMRFSIQTYPGTRSGAVLLPAITASHGLVLVATLMTRLPYDRVSLLIGYIVHLLWAYGLYIAVHRQIRQRIAVVPVGDTSELMKLDQVDWHLMSRCDLAEAAGTDAIVVDFADLPNEWEALLADAALEGRVVYQTKSLFESLTGRVQVKHLSENSFGYLVPMRAYAYLKSLGDWLFAVVLLPLCLPVLALSALAIKLDSKGPIIFRQRRIGRGGKMISIYKFRTMRVIEDIEDVRQAAITADGDARITRVGAFLRNSRLDELPQIVNILKFEMSWIGPRPEAEVLSTWYRGNIPFYRYRHVVKPGISGWAQVNQGHVAGVEDTDAKLQYDFFYIKYFSPWLDIVIAFRTVKTMLSGFGAR